MNEFNIKVDIKNNKIIAPTIELVQNDYNSTKLKFDFTDDDNYIKVFQLQLPDGSMWVKDIIDNEVVLANEKDGQIVPILIQNGQYKFDVVVYKNNAKLTTTNKESFQVRSEMAGQDIKLDDRLPILDSLIQGVNEAINDVSTAKADAQYAKEQGDYAKEEAKRVDNVVDYVVKTSERAEIIAKGRATGYVFDTIEDLELWLQDETNTSKLVLGDNLYIRALGVPDYWWDGSGKQQLETQKVDLEEYQKATELEEKTFDITYEDGTTETIRSVVYK